MGVEVQGRRDVLVLDCGALVRGDGLVVEVRGEGGAGPDVRVRVLDHVAKGGEGAPGEWLGGDEEGERGCECGRHCASAFLSSCL